MATLVRVHGQGIDQLQLDEVELRELASNEVRMTVKASRITGDQLNYIKGLRLPGEAIHEISSLGYEAAGIVTAIGKAVDEKWLGKRVMPVGPYDFERYPSLGDDIIVPASRLVEIPDNIDFAAAASTWVPYLTAYPVYSQSNLKSGDYVLIIAGTSAVGQAAIDLARELGAIPIVTTRSRRKAAQLRQLKQLNHVIISNEEDL
ncbi:MAG: oxidoreductase, partial [Streptococcus sp.]|nr:oxidoreductase [Streptococcus sp.]